MKRALLWILLGLPLQACHLGPFYDIYEVSIGPQVPELAARAEAGIRAGETPLPELLSLLGPPSKIERHRESLILTYNRRSRNRHWFGIGVGMFGFNLHLFDHDTDQKPEQRLVFLVEDELVMAVGNTLSGVGDGTE
ncbi:MAG: hypothetical protein V2A76_13780 [Planctomycetota bacterium]